MEKIVTDKKKIDEILDRGIIAEVLPSKGEFRNALLSGKKLRLYIGFDPTSSALHLSHAKNFMLMEEFRKLGHEVIILFGDFTARIGDPSGRDSARKQLSKADVEKNVRSWKKQISPLMDFEDPSNPPRILYNSKWLAELKFEELLALASHFTVQRMLERDMFEKRIKGDQPIYLHEFFYPLMQGYDSVVMDVDAEVCGTDQVFNALAGRKLLRQLKDKEKFVIALNLMENPVTGEMMSKSRGVGVFLDTGPNEMYGAIMAQPDEMTEVLFINVTRIPLNEVKSVLSKENPRDAKARVAREIVSIFYGPEAAQEAQNEFKRVFSGKGAPKDVPEYSVENQASVIDVLLGSGMVSSRAEAKRLVEQGAVSINGIKVDKWDAILKPEAVIKIGAHRFLKLTHPRK